MPVLYLANLAYKVVWLGTVENRHCYLELL